MLTELVEVILSMCTQVTLIHFKRVNKHFSKIAAKYVLKNINYMTAYKVGRLGEIDLINQVLWYKKSIFIGACRGGHLNIAKKYYIPNIDIALINAYKSGNIELIMFMHQTYKVDPCIFMYACDNNNIKLINYVISNYPEHIFDFEDDIVISGIPIYTKFDTKTLEYTYVKYDPMHYLNRIKVCDLDEFKEIHSCHINIPAKLIYENPNLDVIKYAFENNIINTHDLLKCKYLKPCLFDIMHYRDIYNIYSYILKHGHTEMFHYIRKILDIKYLNVNGIEDCMFSFDIYNILRHKEIKLNRSSSELLKELKNVFYHGGFIDIGILEIEKIFEDVAN